MSQSRANTLARSLRPDERFKLEGLKMRSEVKGKSVSIYISCERGARSMSETLDDLLRAVKLVLEITESLAK